MMWKSGYQLVPSDPGRDCSSFPQNSVYSPDIVHAFNPRLRTDFKYSTLNEPPFKNGSNRPCLSRACRRAPGWTSWNPPGQKLPTTQPRTLRRCSHSHPNTDCTDQHRADNLEISWASVLMRDSGCSPEVAAGACVPVTGMSDRRG